jgi:23S rRNA (guanosine2251-2'-O)-methyltransferase
MQDPKSEISNEKSEIHSPLILEGSISVLAALEAARRPIEAVYVQAGKDIRSLDRIERAARAKGIPLKQVAEAEISALAQGATHGGVLALAGERNYQSLEELIAGQKDAFVAMLDGVEDPFNYGQAIRALYAAGAHGLVVPERNWDSALSVVTRASAGASEYMLTARVVDAKEAIAFFKAHGFRIAATAKEKTSISLYAVDLHGPLFMLIGGERRGLNAAALAQCDVLLEIPYGRDFKAELDVTSSTAALAFEVMRQRVWPARLRRAK